MRSPARNATMKSQPHGPESSRGVSAIAVIHATLKSTTSVALAVTLRLRLASARRRPAKTVTIPSSTAAAMSKALVGVQVTGGVCAGGGDGARRNEKSRPVGRGRWERMGGGQQRRGGHGVARQPVRIRGGSARPRFTHAVTPQAAEAREVPVPPRLFPVCRVRTGLLAAPRRAWQLLFGQRRWPCPVRSRLPQLSPESVQNGVARVDSRGDGERRA